jgi:ATP-dependent DNA helicase RecG
MKDAGLPGPIFHKEGIFTVTLFRPVNVSAQTIRKTAHKGREKSREKSREKILALMSADASVTMDELADSTGVSVKATEKQIALLKKAGKIERVGPDKGGHWKINEVELD